MFGKGFHLLRLVVGLLINTMQVWTSISIVLADYQVLEALYIRLSRNYHAVHWGPKVKHHQGYIVYRIPYLI